MDDKIKMKSNKETRQVALRSHDCQCPECTFYMKVVKVLVSYKFSSCSFDN